MTIVTGLELMYRDSGNVIHFLFFMMQFFPPILKTTIPKYNIKNKQKIFLNFNHREKLCFTEFSTRNYWNKRLVASGLFLLFTQPNKFYKFHWNMLRKRLFITQTENEEWLLLSASFTENFELALVLTQGNAFS